jgi:hypothetical protein
MSGDQPTVKVTLHTSPYTPSESSTGYPAQQVKWGHGSAVVSAFYTDFIRQLECDLSLFPPGPPPTRRQKIRSKVRTWWYWHRPILHFGPCHNGDCY